MQSIAEAKGQLTEVNLPNAASALEAAAAYRCWPRSILYYCYLDLMQDYKTGDII